jgi:hypothetical protein
LRKPPAKPARARLSGLLVFLKTATKPFPAQPLHRLAPHRSQAKPLPGPLLPRLALPVLRRRLANRRRGRLLQHRDLRKMGTSRLPGQLLRRQDRRRRAAKHRPAPPLRPFPALRKLRDRPLCLSLWPRQGWRKTAVKRFQRRPSLVQEHPRPRVKRRPLRPLLPRAHLAFLRLPVNLLRALQSEPLEPRKRQASLPRGLLSLRLASLNPPARPHLVRLLSHPA